MIALIFPKRRNQFRLGTARILICLASLTCPSSGYASDSLKECVKSICANAGVSEDAVEFAKRETVKHPNLDNFYAKFSAPLENLRVARINQIRLAYKVLSEPSTVEKQVRELEDPDLLRYLIAVRPWNLTKVLEGANYIVRPEPTLPVSISDYERVIAPIFEKAQKISPLFRAHSENEALGTSPDKAYPPIAAGPQWYTELKTRFTKRILKLPLSKQRPLFRSLKDTLKYSAMYPAYARNNVLLDGASTTDLALGIQEGKLQLPPSDRKIIENVIITMIQRSLETNHTVLMAPGLIHTKKAWGDACKVAYNRSLHFALKPGEIYLLKSKLADATKRGNRVLIDIFGAETATLLGKFVSTLDVQFPFTLFEYEAYVGASLQAYLANSMAELDMIESYELISGVGPKIDNDTVVSAVCNGYALSPLNDSASVGRIQLSSFSSKYPDIGVAILLHEIGHAITLGMASLSAQTQARIRFESIRKCISTTYSSSTINTVQSPGHFEGDHQWTEEDWADTFSAYSLRDTSMNAGCALVSESMDPLYFTDRSSTDPHSPGYYRVLLTHSQMNKIFPPACELSLKNYAPTMPLTSCFTL